MEVEIMTIIKFVTEYGISAVLIFLAIKYLLPLTKEVLLTLENSNKLIENNNKLIEEVKNIMDIVSENFNENEKRQNDMLDLNLKINNVLDNFTSVLATLDISKDIINLVLDKVEKDNSFKIDREIESKAEKFKN